MGEAGVLRSADRVELLNGIIVDMLPIGPFHGGVVNRLIHVFEQLSQGRWVTSAQNPVSIDEYSEPQPDLLLLRPRDDFYDSGHPKPHDVLLLVEVADSTLRSDREGKLPIYAAAGIREVWLINLPERVVEVYTKPDGRRYTSMRRVRPIETLAPEAFPDAVVDVSKLLGGGVG